MFESHWTSFGSVADKHALVSNMFESLSGISCAGSLEEDHGHVKPLHAEKDMFRGSWAMGTHLATSVFNGCVSTGSSKTSLGSVWTAASFSLAALILAMSCVSFKRFTVSSKWLPSGCRDYAVRLQQVLQNSPGVATIKQCFFRLGKGTL